MDCSTIHEEDNLSRQKSEQKKSPRLTSSSKPFKKSFFLVATLWRFSLLCNSSLLNYQFTSTTEPLAKHLVPRTFHSWLHGEGGFDLGARYICMRAAQDETSTKKPGGLPKKCRKKNGEQSHPRSQ